MDAKRRSLLGLLLFNAVSAVGGGLALMLDWIPEQASWVRDTDFESNYFPGVILLAVVGGSSLIAAVATLKRSDGWELADPGVPLPPGDLPRDRCARRHLDPGSYGSVHRDVADAVAPRRSHGLMWPSPPFCIRLVTVTAGTSTHRATSAHPRTGQADPAQAPGSIPRRQHVERCTH
ncbi:hypothetical protein NSZ01_40930 [Nocardioides szechwanensis]|uniref:hypothetical protein n=1 Tax=Nocardioides szechwanensis TaxID=1005944 RepID=UPI00115FB54C|nr:hypothetical protein [Nocardioides szechwanensis]GEP36325.1 hypothetical protein NSZ01_40930 [Nocardioides szechwanensis]